MTKTQNDPNTRHGVLTIGLTALAEHITEHQLPFPTDISTPYNEMSPPYLRIRVAHLGDQMRWLNSVHVDGEDVSDRGEYTSTTWHVRLPGTGTRIELVGTQPAQRLALVEGASA